MLLKSALQFSLHLVLMFFFLGGALAIFFQRRDKITLSIGLFSLVGSINFAIEAIYYAYRAEYLEIIHIITTALWIISFLILGYYLWITDNE